MRVTIANNIHPSLTHRPGHQCLKKERALFDGWISVDLNQPGVEFLIEKEIESEYLKAELPLILVEFLPHRTEGDPNDVLHLLREPRSNDLRVRLAVVRTVLRDKLPQLRECPHVPVLELPVILAKLLNRIIRQMDEQVLQLILVRAERGT